MARRPVDQLKDPKRRKQIAVPAGVVLALITVAFCFGAYTWWDKVACTAELEEATGSLLRLFDSENAYREKKGHYVAMAPCDFTEESARCVSRLGFSILGKSHFAYRVDSDGSTFVATAVGAGGRHFGSVLRIDDSGTLDLGGAQCRD